MDSSLGAAVVLVVVAVVLVLAVLVRRVPADTVGVVTRWGRPPRIVASGSRVLIPIVERLAAVVVQHTRPSHHTTMLVTADDRVAAVSIEVAAELVDARLVLDADVSPPPIRDLGSLTRTQRLLLTGSRRRGAQRRIDPDQVAARAVVLALRRHADDAPDASAVPRLAATVRREVDVELAALGLRIQHLAVDVPGVGGA